MNRTIPKEEMEAYPTGEGAHPFLEIEIVLGEGVIREETTV